MRRLIINALVGLALVAGGSAQAAGRQDPQAQLARAIAGRVAGKPVDCIDTNNLSSQVIDKTAIIYGSGRTIYVNRPTSGASSLDSTYTLVTNTTSPRLCSVDIVRLFDSSAHMPAGSVGLGQFIPYTRAAATAAN